MHFDDATHEDVAPSRQELLERAAELGPARLTYASMLLPTDPILNRKMQPNVAERRARLRAVVKVALGACVAFCVFAATRASAMPSGPSTTNEAHVTPAIPAVSVVSVEKLDQPETTKAPSHASPQHAAPVAARWKRK